MERESRFLKINWRVFTKIDIRRLAQIAYNLYKNATKNKHHSKISFRLYCEGGISYESDSLSIFDDGGPLDLKKTRAIQIIFNDFDKDRSIDIDLREGNIGRGTLDVTGTDKNWVQGNFTTLYEIINTVKPQENIFLKYKRLVFHIVAFGIGSLIYLIADLLLFQFLPNPLIINTSSTVLLAIGDYIKINPWFGYIIIILLLWLQGILTFAYPVYHWLIDLWPEIEFDFGPEHMKKHKIRRQRIWVIVSLVIIPIIINIVSVLFF